MLTFTRQVCRRRPAQGDRLIADGPVIDVLEAAQAGVDDDAVHVRRVCVPVGQIASSTVKGTADRVAKSCVTMVEISHSSSVLYHFSN